MTSSTRLRRIVAEILDGNSDSAVETLLEREQEPAPELALVLPELKRDPRPTLLPPVPQAAASPGTGDPFTGKLEARCFARGPVERTQTTRNQDQ